MTMPSLKSLTTVLVGLILSVFAVYGQTEPRRLLVGIEDLPPFSYLGENGKPKGVCVEVMSRALSRLNIPAEFKMYPFARGWMMATHGELDALAPVSYQQSREEYLVYQDWQRHSDVSSPSNYLAKAEIYLFFRSQHKERYGALKNFDDSIFKAARVGTVKDYGYSQSFRNAEMKRVVYTSPQAAVAALAKGEVDLVPLVKEVGLQIVESLGLSEELDFGENPIITRSFHFALAKKSTYPGLEKLSRQFNAELKKMHDSGEYDSIVESYVRPEYIEELSRPLVFVCEEWMPFEYMDGQQVKGCDALAVDRIMRRLGVPYKIEIYPWSRAWMMAEKGKADAVLSISYKESREQTLYFTENQRQFAKDGTLPENYLWMSEYVFFVKKQSANKLKFDSYDQIKADGLKVGKNRDYSYCPEFLAAELGGPVYSDTEQGFLALLAGDIDLYPMDKTVGAATLEKLGLSGSVTYLPKTIFKKPYLSPFCRNSDIAEIDKIMNSFYRELRLMRKDGSYKKLLEEAIKSIKTDN